MAGNETELWPWWLRCVSTDRERFDALLARHREPHRRYHGVGHVAWVIRHVDDLVGDGAADVASANGELPLIVAAAFFHDAVYDPRSTTNEVDSASLALRELAVADWSTEAAARVSRMIEGTADHRDPPDAATAVLYDADLAVLGADPAAYQQYLDGIRFEYRFVDDEAWRRGRAAVLEGFLDREHLYATEPGRERWAARAVANLQAELASLR